MKTIYIYVIGNEFVPETFGSLEEADAAAEKHGNDALSGPWEVVVEDCSEKLLALSREAVAVGQVMIDRLDLNDVAGEEKPFIADAEHLISTAKSVIEELQAS